MNTIDERLKSLSPAKRELLIKKLREKKLANERDAGRIVPVETEDGVYPLTSSQNEIWLASSIYPNKPIYNNVGMVRIQGDLNTSWIADAFTDLVQRQAVLRTAFIITDDGVKTKVEKDIPFTVELSDYSGHHQDREQIIKCCLEKDKRIVFDLTQPPLLHVHLFCTARNDWTLILVIHHIISDGISTGIILNEIIKYYALLQSGSSHRHQSLPYQYKDYAIWQSKQPQPDSEFWDKYLIGKDEMNLLTGNISASDCLGRPAAQHRFGLSAEEYAALNRISVQTSATVFSVLLAALSLTVSLYAYQDKCLLGVVTSGRENADVSSLIGCFIKTLPFRIDINGDQTVAEFIRAVQNSFSDSFRNRASLSDQRHSAAPQVIFSYEESPAHNMPEVDGFNIDFQEVFTRYSKCAMQIELNKTGDKIDGWLNYPESVFSAEFIAHFTNTFIYICRQFEKNLTVPICSFSFVHESERKLIKETFNATDLPFASEETVAERWNGIVQKYKERPALCMADKVYSYMELDTLSDRVAARLLGLGAKPGEFIVILAERSAEMIIAMLAVVKSGACYVPIAADTPPKRLKMILEDCAPRALLFYHASCPEGYEKLDLDDPALYAEAAVPVSATAPHKCPDDPLYCIYTSGTTGRPKGVLLCDTGVVNLQAYFQHELHVVPEDRILQFASLNFDASVWEIYMALLTGACLVIPQQSEINDTKLMNELFIKRNVTIATLPPQYAAHIDLHSLHTLITAGSAANGNVIRQAEGVRRFVNAYGPTETTVCATAWYYGYEEPLGEYIPIGKPISNMKAMVMHGNLNCGLYMPGELCVAGPGLALGYNHLDEQTAAAFGLDPTGRTRIYHTGDIVSWQADGNLRFYGRKDAQVKIRGFRIELGEVEHAVRQAPGVTDVCVKINGNGADASIDAYLVGAEPLDIGGVIRTCRTYLPDYMVPARYQQIGSIPLNQNGKPDLTALPEITQSSAAGYAAPENDQEKTFAAIAEDVLKLKNVSMNSNFFEIGGDSIKAIRISSLLHEKGYNLPVKEMMQRSVLRDVCRKITLFTDTKGFKAEGEVKGELAPTPIMTDFETWKFDRAADLSQSMLLRCKTGVKLNPFSARKAVTVLMRHHDMLRLVRKNGAYLIRGMDEARLCDFSIYRMEGYTDAQEIMTAECRRLAGSFDLEEGPLIHAASFSTDQGDYVFISAHHLVEDTVSMRILAEDFISAYIQFEQDPGLEQPYLPMKTSSYIDWSIGLRKYASSQDCQLSLPYWQQVCKQIAALDLPKVDPAHPHTYAQTVMVLPEKLTHQLVLDSVHAYHTNVNDILLAALANAFAAITERRDMSVMIEHHGRESRSDELDVSRTVGWFTYYYPVMIQAQGNARDSMIKTKEILRVASEKRMSYLSLKQFDPSCLSDVTADVNFNYLGEFATGNDDPNIPFTVISEAERQNESGGNKKDAMLCPIVINCSLIEKRLHFDIRSDTEIYSKDKANALTAAYRDKLTELAEHCMASKEEVFTSSDLGMAGIDQSVVDNLTNMFSK